MIRCFQKTSLKGLQEKSKILIDVGFGTLSKKKTTWDTNGVDFIFRIETREKWSIGIFRQELKDLIKIIQGKTNFPIVYKVKKEKSKPKKKSKNDNPKLFEL